MRKIILLCLLSAWSFCALAQVQTRIIGDSIDMRSNTGKAELRLENSTDSVRGFLYNKGAGRTEFRHGLVKISDTLYAIGADTLRLSNVGGNVTGNSVFYVSKKYTGTAHAQVTGFTVASISSTNASYRAQLAKAVPGSMVFSYPDPYAARNAAMEAIAAGTIPNAQVIILEGNTYTIGSNDSSKNGNITGSAPNNGTIADIQFSSASITADTSISSLMKNKVDMYFCTGTAFTYINSAYFIYCCFNHDSASFRSGIYGLGSFYQVYGQVNNFSAVFFNIRNRLSFTDFHAREVVIQQVDGFVFGDYSICNVEVDNVISADANVFIMSSPPGDSAHLLNGSAANKARQVNVRVKNFRFGKGQTPYPDSQDIWYGILVGNVRALEGTEVSINIGNMYMYATNAAPLFYVGTGATVYGLRMVVNIDNLVHRDSHVHYDNMPGGLMYCYNTGVAINNVITYNINTADIDAPMLGMMNFSSVAGNKNNRFNINVGSLIKNPSAFLGGLFKLTGMNNQVAGAEPMRIKIKGNFTSYDTSALIYAFNEWYSYPFANRYEFSGRFETKTAGIPVARFYANTGKILALTDVLLLNDGVTPSIFADSTCSSLNCNCCQLATPLSIPVYIKNVHANTAAGSNIQQVGDVIKVVTDIPSFFN